ncbi:MAG: outer membrane beta-barrel protein [Nitrospiraceae bacterium]
MDWLRFTRERVFMLGSWILLVQTLTQAPVFAETYVAGQIGYTVPHSLTSVEFDDPDPVFAGIKSSNLDLKNSLMYGAKLGHYLNSARWFGLEMEAFHTSPHIKQQNVTLTVPAGGSLVIPDQAGATLRVTTLAFNLLARYPGERFQPYAAAGVGVFFANLDNKANNDSQSSVAPGLNTQVGLRYLLTQHVAIFGEWKFNYARFGFNDTPALIGFNATYIAHHFVFGVGYHF